MPSPEWFEYRGKSVKIPNYSKTICNNCGEEVADERSVRHSTLQLRDAQRIIDGLLTSSEIKKIRKRFHLTQDSFSELLGGGEKAFARYESGKVCQRKPMDNLLRVLREYPEAINAFVKTYDRYEHCVEFQENKTQYEQESDDDPFQYTFEGRIKAPYATFDKFYKIVRKSAILSLRTSD